MRSDWPRRVFLYLAAIWMTGGALFFFVRHAFAFYNDKRASVDELLRNFRDLW